MGRTLVSLALLLAWIGNAHAQVPRVLNYQGKLTDASGAALPDRAYTIAFRLYETLGGTPAWTEEQTVNVRGGVFNVRLGAAQNNPLPASLGQRQLYIQASVGALQVLPATPLAVVPYAHAAAKVDLRGVDAAALATNSVGGDALGPDSITTAQVQGGAAGLQHVTVAAPLVCSKASTAGATAFGDLCTLTFSESRTTTVLLVAKVAAATHRCTGTDDLVAMSSTFRVEVDGAAVLEATDGGTVNTELGVRQFVNSAYLARPVTLTTGSHVVRLRGRFTNTNCTEEPQVSWTGASLALHRMGVNP